MPQLGKIIANDEQSYQYLAESIRKHQNLAKKNAPFFPLMGGYQCDALQANGLVRSVKL
jgi:ubiquinone/menaquinone biosynthesis C-methylase UbiE